MPAPAPVITTTLPPTLIPPSNPRPPPPPGGGPPRGRRAGGVGGGAAAATLFRHQGAAGGSVRDAVDFVHGDGALRVTTDGEGIRTNVRAVGVATRDLLDAHVRLALHVHRVELLDVVLPYLSSDDFASY